MFVGFVLWNLRYLTIGHLEAHTEREGEGDDDQEQRDAGEDPAAQPYTSIVLVRCNSFLRNFSQPHNSPSTDIFLALCAEGVRGGSL